MNCQKIQMLILESIDSKEPLSNEILDHIANCPACAEYQLSMQNVDNLFAENAENFAEVSHDLNSKIMQACLNSKPESAAPKSVLKFNKIIYASSLIAASLVIAFIFHSGQNNSTKTQTPINTGTPIAKTPASADNENVESTKAISWLLKQNPSKAISKAVPAATNKLIPEFNAKKAKENTIFASSKKAASLLLAAIASNNK